MSDSIPDNLSQSTKRPIAWSTVRGTLGVFFWVLYAAISLLSTSVLSGPEVAIGASLVMTSIGCLASIGEKQRPSEKNMTAEQRGIVSREIQRATLLALLLSGPVVAWILFSRWNEDPALVFSLIGTCLVFQIAPASLFGRSNGRFIVRQLQVVNQATSAGLGDKLHLWDDRSLDENRRVLVAELEHRFGVLSESSRRRLQALDQNGLAETRRRLHESKRRADLGLED